MNNQRPIFSGVLAVAFLVPAMIANCQNETNSLNHIRFVSRVAFGISASFKHAGDLPLSPNGRATPDGHAYNYGDGYVLTDVSGNRGGQTWNWGYDNASQVSGNTILMHQNSVSQNLSSSASADLSNPGWGGELVYDREFGSRGDMHYGLESAVSYLNLSLQASGSGVGDITQTTDAYSFSSGTTPPAAPYQGTFNGPGFLLGSTPASSSSTVMAGAASITSSQKLKANIWGLRLGPYLEFPVDDRVEFSLSGGLGVALLDASVSWAEIVNTGSGTMNLSGSGHNMGLLWGGYLGANLSWKLSKHWDAEAGAQYEYLGAYRHVFGATEVELDSSKSISVTLGISYSF